ncbi:hypothetical protein H8891_07605 [Paeniclostridium sp. NSJ-45]|uniref:DUF1129 family protein n=1 Tax=Paeniclostridium hominis TaxID=2764329 RepID=A0ABR7K480_9FIRM|nr:MULTISPECIES: hypothetical protein [Paeniclostridium]MBC6003664.1 hypothetical protein [Paeniclostridium hominis]
MGNAKELIELNNTYREQLNEENKEFYDDILVYIRAKSFFKDERQVEESLLEILTDIIEAQNQEVKASDYFGKNPKEISDEILKNTNKMSFKDMIKLILSTMGLYTLVTVLPKLINPSEGLDLGKFFIGLVITFLFVEFIINFVGNTVYSNKSKKFTFTIVALFCIYICLIISMKQFLPTMLEIKLTGVVGITIISILGVVGIIYGLKEKLFYSFLPIILVACTLGILNRLEFTKFLINEEPGKTISILAMVIAFVLMYLITYLQTRDKKNKESQK